MPTGHKTGGRSAGTPNKRTQDLVTRLQALGVDPLEGLAAIAKDESAPLELRAKVMTDLMPYLYPKRKSLEVADQRQLVSINIGIPQLREQAIVEESRPLLSGVPAYND